MKKRGKMKTRWMSLLLCMSMLLSNVPVTAFAEGESETAVETEVMTEAGTDVVTEAMTEAGTEAMTESETSAETESQGITEKEESVEKDVTDQAAEEQKAAADAAKVAQVQALADALPDTVTLENKEETGKQLNALIAAYGNLESTLQEQIDLTKYDRVLAAMYELEGMSGAQEPQLLADSYLRVYDRVVGGEDGYVDGLVFRATNSNGEVKEIKNGDSLESMGFRPDRTYSCTLIKNTTGYNYEAEDSFTINRGSNSSGTANLYVYRQHDLTVTVKDSLNNIVPNATVTLRLPGGGKRTSTTNASGVVIFDKIRGLYTVTASVSYTKENGETGTITSNEIYMKPGNQSVTLTIPRETKVSVKVSGYSDDFLMDNDVGNATVTVQNSRNESVTLTHGSDGNYTGLIKRTSSGIESFKVSVSANGYKDSTTTVSSFGGLAISTTVKLNMKDYQVNGISNNQQMSTGEKYNVSVIPTDMPEDWTLEIWDKDDGFDITKADGTWTIVPKKSGTFTLQFDLQGIVNESPVVMVLEEFKISVRKGTTTYPNAPSIGKEDTDVTTETFTLPSDIKLAQKLTVKAKDTTSGSVLKEQEFTDLTPGKKISMKLKDTVVQGKIHYTFTYFSDAVTYEGTVSTSEKAYYKSISDITVGATTLEYNGQAQHPQVSCSGEYVIKTGYNFLNIEEFFTECETSIPNENNSVIWDIGIGNPSPISIDQYVLKITGDESKFYKGTESFTYTIEKRPITLTVKNQDITYGSSISSGIDAVTVSAGSVASGHVLSLTATPSTNAPTQNGSIKVSDVKISDGGNDVTKHYSVTVDNNPATLTISQISMDRIQVDVPESVVYNGTEQTPLVVTLDGNTLKEGQDYTAEYKNNKNAGTAEVTVSAAAWEENVTRTFEIQKKSLTAQIQNADKVYDGEKTANNASIVLSGIYAPDDIGLDVEKLVISYLDANAGEEKEVRASNMELTGEAAGNYQLIDADGNVTNTISGKGSISKRTVIVTADNLQKTYGQEDPALTWKHNENIVEGEELTGIHINRAAGENVGDYKITVSQSENANSNYEITFISGTFTIQPKELTVTVDNLDKQYDGLNGASFSSALNGIVRNDKVELDSTGVTAKFSDVTVGEDIDIIFEGEFKLLCDETTAGNYYLTQPAGIKADIYNEYEATQYIVSPDSWTNENVSIIPEEGYLISTENVDGEGKWENVLTFDVSTPKEGQEITFYLRNMETKAISLPKTVTYYIDKINPVGTITLAGKSWMELLNNITFGMFFNETKTVTIEAEDDLSGIASVEYYESDKALSQSELESVTEWQLYNGTVDITLEDAKKFVYYAKLTDIAGNITYLSTDGAVYDTTAPAIEGVEEKEYCTTQTVTVTDVNLDKITVNESEVTSPFKLAGDVEENYIIVATDKAGNSTTMTVTMKKLNIVDDPIEELNTTNVTSDQKEEVQSVLDKVNELLQDEDITEEETKQLEDLKANAEELLETLQKAEDAVSSEEIKEVENVDSSNAELGDKEGLQDAKDALENALTENGSNYTEEEKKEIQEEIDRIEGAIASIEKTEEVITDIKNLPEEIDTDLGAEEEQEILDIKAAYDELSEHEKTLVNKELVEKLETLLEVLVDYQIIEGDGSKWTKGSGKQLNFVANGPYRKFAFIEVDGKKVDTDLYKVTEGSTVINLKSSYLEKLSEGKHIITVYYADGEAEGIFKILPAPSEETTDPTGDGAVLTGDTTNVLVWVSLMCLSMLYLIGLFVKRRIVK